jgi:hypothetical protein
MHEFFLIKDRETKQRIDYTTERELGHKIYLSKGKSLRETWTPLDVAWSY